MFITQLTVSNEWAEEQDRPVGVLDQKSRVVMCGEFPVPLLVQETESLWNLTITTITPVSFSYPKTHIPTWDKFLAFINSTMEGYLPDLQKELGTYAQFKSNLGDSKLYMPYIEVSNCCFAIIHELDNGDKLLVSSGMYPLARKEHMVASLFEYLAMLGADPVTVAGDFLDSTIKSIGRHSSVY